METNTKQTAKELGFNPVYKPLSPEDSELFIKILMGDMKEGFEEEMTGSTAPFPIQILEKRLQAFDLKLKFNSKAKLLLLIYTEGNPGRIVTSLIDC